MIQHILISDLLRQCQNLYTVTNLTHAEDSIIWLVPNWH